MSIRSIATVPAAAPDDLEAETEIFRNDEEAAQQFPFAYLGIRAITAECPGVLEAVNRNPMFWISSKESLLISTSIWLERVFDQNSAHNIDLLLKMVERNLPTLNRDALRERKEKVITPEQTAEYVKHNHETTIHDVRALKTAVRAWRKVYEPIYQPVRHHLAHNKVKDPADLAALMSKTNIEEMKSRNCQLGYSGGLRAELTDPSNVPEDADTTCALSTAIFPG